jgi:integrase
MGTDKEERSAMATYLKRVSTMFAVAIREPTSPFAGMANPCAGIALLGKDREPKTARDKAFTAAQARLIVETAERSKLGLKRKDGIVWMLKLLAYTGCRPREISQLQGGDVGETDGVKFLHIRSTDAITGRVHPQKSVKPDNRARVVPLHPALADFYEYASKVGKGEFVFKAFKWNKDNGREWRIERRKATEHPKE